MLNQLFTFVSFDEVNTVIVDYEFGVTASGCDQFNICEPRRVLINWANQVPFYSGGVDLLDENLNGAKNRAEILLQARGN